MGAQIHLGSQADPDYAFVSISDGSTVEMGSVRLQVLETPGHTPEGICVLVYDLNVDADKPHAVLTGDTLFIGDVGRPDLMASIGVSADDLAVMMYDSLRTKLLPLADETLVYPGHGAGSLCGKNLSTDTVSTIGVQRLFNYALQPMSKRKFILILTEDQTQAPQYFAYDAALNKRERPTLDQTIERVMVPLTLAELLEQQAPLRLRQALSLTRLDPSSSLPILALRKKWHTTWSHRVRQYGWLPGQRNSVIGTKARPGSSHGAHHGSHAGGAIGVDRCAGGARRSRCRGMGRRPHSRECEPAPQLSEGQNR